MNQIEQQFLTSDQLAERYGLSLATIADWRRKDKNKKDSEKKYPNYYTLPKYAVSSGSAKVRYDINEILEWEKTMNITPKNPF